MAERALKYHLCGCLCLWWPQVYWTDLVQYQVLVRAFSWAAALLAIQFIKHPALKAGYNNFECDVDNDKR